MPIFYWPLTALNRDKLYSSYLITPESVINMQGFVIILMSKIPTDMPLMDPIRSKTDSKDKGPQAPEHK